MTRRDTLLAGVVVLVWGANFVAIEVGVARVPPLAFLALRFTLVSLATLVVPRPQVSWRRLLAIGLTLNLGQFSGLYLAMGLGLPGGVASLLVQAQVVFTIAIAAGMLGERPSRRQLVGVGVGVGGLAALLVERWTGAAWVAAVLALAGSASWAVGNVLVRGARVRSGGAMVVWTAPVVPLPALGLSLLIDGPATVGHAFAGFGAVALLSTAYTVVLASFVGYGIWNGLLARNPAARVAPFALLLPIVGVLAGWVAFGERPTVLELAAGVVMLTGLAVATLHTAPAQPTGVPGSEVPAAVSPAPAPASAPSLDSAR